MDPGRQIKQIINSTASLTKPSTWTFIMTIRTKGVWCIQIWCWWIHASFECYRKTTSGSYTIPNYECHCSVDRRIVWAALPDLQPGKSKLKLTLDLSVTKRRKVVVYGRCWTFPKSWSYFHLPWTCVSVWLLFTRSDITHFVNYNTNSFFKRCVTQKIMEYY